MIKMSPQYRSGCNCIHMSISNILEYLDFSNPLGVWKQCGLKYIRDEDPSKMGILYSNRMNFQDELYWIHNIKVNKFNSTDKNDFINNIKSFINDLKPVVVFVDPYYLKQAPSYQNLHGKHTITIIGYEDNKFNFIDDVFNFKGTISKEALIECASNNHKSPGVISFVYFFISIEENKYLREEEYRIVIDQNLKNLKSFNNIEAGNYSGYEGLKAFNEDFFRIFNSREFLKDEITDLYQKMVSCASQHFLFGQFLSSAEGTNEEIKKIELLLSDLAQEMKVCANMFLKATITIGNNEKIFNRIVPKLENTYLLGRNLTELMEAFLRKSN